MKIVVYWFYYLTYGFLPFGGKLLVSDIFKGISGKLVKKFEKVLATPEIKC